MVAWIALLCALAGCARHEATSTQAQQVTVLDRAEAAQADWQSTAPPATGWVQVTLMDSWDQRWPKHDGVVWYRLHWNQTDAGQPIGLLLDYACMADAVWVNGSEVYRDPQLVEPLSRRWIAPQYFLIDKPLLRAGENTVLVRVSGLVAYQPGLGVVRVGDPAALHRQYRDGTFWRYEIHLFNFALGAVLGVLFFIFWLLRRKETVFGWYALSTLLDAGYAWNYVATSTWPFADTDTWEAVNTAFFVASSTIFCVFLLRFCERRWRRVELGLLLATVFTFAMALTAPHTTGVWRNAWNLPAVALFYAATVLYLWHAVRTWRADLCVMGACLLLPVLVSLRDMAVYMGWMQSSIIELRALTSPITLIGMGFAVAWRFSAAMRRVEGFNVELQREVEQATTRLSETLSREHTLALSHTRIGERLNLVRDLHDGFGGSLLGAIAQLELEPTPEAVRTVTTLKELRDDLRLVIDTTTRDADTDLAGLLASLRHRWSQRFEAVDIGIRWRMDGIDGLRLGAARSLDLLRFLQEALTNALKHGEASFVEVALILEGGRLCVVVSDDGRGFDPRALPSDGAGLASLRARATRLGGALTLNAEPGRGVTIRMEAPLQEDVRHDTAPVALATPVV